MKKFHRILIVVVCSFLIAFPFSGCNENIQTSESKDSLSTSETSSDESVDPFGKYETPITVSTVMFGQNIRNVPEGMTVEDNPWIKKFKEYGINVIYKFVASDADDLNTKINIAIAANDLPDIIPVNAQQFNDLYEDDRLYDISSVYDSYATDEVKNLLNQDNGIMAQNAIKEGKKLGIVLPTQYDDYIAVLAIRSDWMKEANLDAPNTLTDVWNIAKTFKDRKMGGTCDIGIGMTKNVLDFLTPSQELLNGYHAYTGIWMEKEGKLVNSSIQPEFKAALEKLSNYYKEGLIDPEFGTKDMAKLTEDAIAGRTGVIVTHFVAPFDLINGVKLGQEWSYHRMPSDDGKVVKAQQSAAFGGAIVYNKNGKNPEAMIKMYNLFEKFTREDFATYNDNAVLNFAYPIYVGVVNANPKIRSEYIEYINTGKKPEIVTQGFDGVLEAAEKYRIDKDIEGGYTMFSVFGPEGTLAAAEYALANDGYLVNKYTGAPTDNMALYAPNLKTIEEQMVTNIINGSKPVSHFDEFIQSWKKNGGDILTQEVNEWYELNK